ncbi:MAG: CoA-binding protein [Pseudomonadota bacterium]
MTDYTNADLRRILTSVKTIACVGVSLNEIRPSFYVARYLSLKGFTVFGVNPRYAGQTAFGQPIAASLADLPQPVDMVDIFRRSEQAGDVVDEALALPTPPKVIWMQIGVVNEAAAARAEAAGVEVIMNRCPKIEYQRLFGELRMGGFNTGIISSRLD